MSETATKEIGFSEKFTAAVAIAEAGLVLQVTNAQEHAAAGEVVNHIRDFEKQLEAEYKTLPVILEAKRIQGEKTALASRLEEARKSAKAKMMKFEDEQEAKRRVEEARLAAIARKMAEDEALARAQALEAKGQKEEAQAVISQPVVTPTVVLPKATPAVSGHSRRTVKKWRYKNADKSGINQQFMTPDEVKIGSVVRSMGKDAESLVGSIEVYSEDV